MYAYIIGTAVDYVAHRLILENQGIGYSILAPNFPTNLIGQEVKIYTYLHVREDVFDLYGFISEADKQLFVLLIGVNKIGPKLALQIMAGITAESFASAIIRSDVKSLTQIKGLGKKNAERLILDLQDKLKKLVTDSPSSMADHQPDLTTDIAVAKGCQEVVEALMVLGYERRLALAQAQSSYNPGLDLNSNIFNALRGLDKSKET